MGWVGLGLVSLYPLSFFYSHALTTNKRCLGKHGKTKRSRLLNPITLRYFYTKRGTGCVCLVRGVMSISRFSVVRRKLLSARALADTGVKVKALQVRSM